MSRRACYGGTAVCWNGVYSRADDKDYGWQRRLGAILLQVSLIGDDGTTGVALVING